MSEGRVGHLDFAVAACFEKKIQKDIKTRKYINKINIYLKQEKRKSKKRRKRNDEQEKVFRATEGFTAKVAAEDIYIYIYIYTYTHIHT